MVKLAILFICGLLAVHHASAYRVKRDSDNSEDVQKMVERAFGQFEDILKNTFSEEKREKLKQDLLEFSNKVTVRGKELIEQADASIKKIGSD